MNDQKFNAQKVKSQTSKVKNNNHQTGCKIQHSNISVLNKYTPKKNPFSTVF